jgi:hypothetical protein
MGPLDFRNTNFSPAAAIVFDPFGPKIPSDGGYPGTDAYGKPWSGYYRGGDNGSTGCQVYDCKFIGTWIGILFSPNGITANCESMHCHHLNFDINNANCFVGCQDQEKRNHIGPGIIAWGATTYVVQIGTYGAHRPGEYEIEDINIAGQVRFLIYDNTGGFYPVNIHDCFGETLLGIGFLGGQMKNSVSRCHFDFATPRDATFFYHFPQIAGNNTTYRDCNFRFYGFYNWPIQINNQNGWNVMDNVGFDCVPVYNNYSGGGQMPFRDCSIGGIHYSQVSAQAVPIDSVEPRYAPSYVINYSMVGKYNQATIQCVGKELKRVALNTVIVAYDLKAIQVGVAGVVTAVDPAHNTFTLSYVPPHIVSGQKYGLFLWKPQLIP